jgi:hypothetical protein
MASYTTAVESQGRSNHKKAKKEMSMSSSPKGNRSTGPQATTAQAAVIGEASVGNAARDEDIRRRAYEMFLERGEQPGRVGPHILILGPDQKTMQTLNQDGSNGEAYVNHLPGHPELILVIPIREWDDAQAVRTVGTVTR